MHVDPRGFQFVTESGLWLSDNTIADVSTTRHGLMSKLPGGTSTFYRGDGTFAAVGGGAGGGMTLLEQHSASNSTSLDFTTWYSASYDLYQITFVSIVLASNNVDFDFRVSTNGGSSYESSSYEYVIMADATSAPGYGQVAGQPNAAAMIIFSNIDNTVSQGINGRIFCYDPGNTSLKKQFEVHVTLAWNTVARRYTGHGSTFWTGTSAINALRFLASSGNITSGTIRIYGLAI